MRLIVILLNCFFINACTIHSAVDLPSASRDVRILVLSRTSDKFGVAHEGYHALETFKPKYLFETNPGWKLSELFDSYVLSKQTESNFTLVSGFEEDMPSTKGYNIYKGDEKYFDRLALKYSVDYILVLYTFPMKWSTGHMRFDSEYGYLHEVTEPFFSYQVAASVYLNGRVALIDVLRLRDKSKYAYPCLSYGWPYKSVSPIGLPDVMNKGVRLNDVPDIDLLKMYAASKDIFEDFFKEALQACSILTKPVDPESKREYYSDESVL